MSGELSFIELGVADADAARAFYGELFDWSFEEPPSGGGFAIETGSIPGGIHSDDPGAGPIAFFRVDDIEAAAERVRELGGRIEQLDDSTNEDDEATAARFGRFRFCRDDQGSPFGLHQPPA